MISNTELDRRWRLTRAVMARENFDWLIASTGHPFGYYRWLTNRTGLGGPLAAIGLEGDVLLASHGDEVHHKSHDSYGVRHLVSCAQLNTQVNTHAPLLVKEMASKPVRRIGLLGTGFIPVSAYQVLRDSFPNASIEDATDLIAPIRAIKSAEEMALIRIAAAMHDEAVELARRTLRPGITGQDVVDEVRHFVLKRGSPTQSLMGGSSPPGEVCRYAGPPERKLQAGDQFAMLIECSERNGYYSEAMPTMCLGEVPAPLKRAYNDVVLIQDTLVNMVRPGMLPSELLIANDRMMAELGYPPEGRLLGHSQGLDLVERPAFSPLGETLSIQHDMVISIHPTVHAQRAWGFPNNLSFHFTALGMERLLKTPNEVLIGG